MSKPASTLSIRLQLPPDDEEATAAAPNPPKVEYLWDRIIFAVVAAAVIVAAVVAGAWYWFATPQQTQSAEAMTATASAVASPATVASVSAPPVNSETNSVAATDTDPSPNTEAEPVLPDTIAPEPMAPASSSSVEAASATFPAASQVEQQVLATASGSREEETATAVQNLAEPEKVASASSRQAGAEAAGTPAREASSPLAKVEILSEHLAHAQLSTEFENRQPLNQADAVIPMNDDGLVTVYLYTELAGLQGETLYYTWYHDDKRVARVRARPQRELTRAYSSKYIDRHMLGQWQVELNSAGGDPLARAEFEVR